MDAAIPFDAVRAHADLVQLGTKFKFSLPLSPSSSTTTTPLDPASPSYNDHITLLASFALDEKTTVPVLISHKPIFIDIAARWVSDQHAVETQFQQLFNHPAAPNQGFYTLVALARVISIFPDVAPLAIYFLKTTSFLDYFAKNTVRFGDRGTHEVLLAVSRLVAHDHDTFMPLVHPSFLESLFSHAWPSVKYLAVTLMATYLQASDKVREQMIHTHINEQESILGPYEGATNVDLYFLPVLEAKRIASSLQELSSLTHTTTTTFPVKSSQLSPLVANLAGVIIPQIGVVSQSASEFVATEGAVTAVRDLAHSLRASRPVLITGAGGSGKTFYIDEAAKHVGHDESMVRIHLGDQSDAKILVGTYSTGNDLGSFEWRAGVLTVAVREGRWVLIEDIDKAPTEILSVLLPLLEKRELLIPSRGETIKAAPGFQLFATIRTSHTKNGVPVIPDIIGKRLWDHIHVETPTTSELKQVLQSRFPLLANLADKFVKTYSTTAQIYTEPKFMSLNKTSQNRQISSRDLIKWAKRVTKILTNHGILTCDQALDTKIYDYIFAEAVDCFTGFLSTFEARKFLVDAIGECLEIPAHQVALFLQKHIPAFAETSSHLVVGRAQVAKNPVVSKSKSRQQAAQRAKFANTNHSLRLLEQIGVAVAMKEPSLLVGETGTGKTTVVQYLASLLNKNITVINVSQQTESGDLLGGYKPIDTKMIALPLKEEFDALFESTFSAKKNEKFMAMVNKCFVKGKWNQCIKLWVEACKMASSLFDVKDQPEGAAQDAPKKRRKTDQALLVSQWAEFKLKLDNFEVQAKQTENSFFFSFVEGSLVQAVRRGDWVLLDEINLASPDTLESIADLLVESPSITLSEKGDADSIKAHPDFRLFACMNPATDIGKRDLPAGLRSRFTELYVQSPDSDIADLLSIIDKYIGRLTMGDEWVGNDIAQLYLAAKEHSENNKIVDGANQRPHFSIRTLSRTLYYVTTITPIYGLRRSLYEGFCMSFLTLLDKASEAILHPIIEQHTLGRLKNPKSLLNKIPPQPVDGNHEYIQFQHYWLRTGPLGSEEQPNYIITPYVQKNLLNLIRASAGGKFPILIQGPTSSGKTSMINFLAKKTGHKFVRINNHEHTDLQEYLGSYVSDSQGRLTFQEGVLVEAVRNGYWIVLDELNLAPTDVLEALNRLLDDNRELFIPETQEIVRPHPDFMLFATQNPPGLYGGRKVLSRAFRNRFLELHFDDIPEDELETILRDRCQIAPSYAKKIVEVYRQLSVQRQSTRLFEQKNSFATLRDLFRWAGREAVGYEQLAANGYMLLGERVRKKEERLLVKQVLEKVLKVKLDVDEIYNSLQSDALISNNSGIVWTKGMRKLSVLVSEAVKYKEPVLLVGETGCGKTTICQVLADVAQKPLHIVNAHQNTETGDIIGAQRPVRNRSENLQKLVTLLKTVLQDASTDDLDLLLQTYNETDKATLDQEQVAAISALQSKLKVLFEWCDGSLIQALKLGDYFLLDEISLADDSVLERLNSVLEPERTLLLAEKGSMDSLVTAADSFQFFATMNPGGDYGKKELSPALRNRFTEIWVPSMEDLDDVEQIVASKLPEDLKPYASVLVKFSEWFGKQYGAGDATSGVISLRDILAWISFTAGTHESVGIDLSILHGACMVFIDSIGTNASATLAETPELLKSKKLSAVKKLSKLLKSDLVPAYLEKYQVEVDADKLRVGPFNIARSTDATDASFNLQAPTTAANALRVMRGMQVKKPILLEGSPGVGKTSLITAIAKVTGHPLTRINLSEQTDLIDLFGSDSPAEGGGADQFVWRDAPFLRAMQQGEWVLLDEMNLASQSVLEGLNACLDHRGETYIPELDRTFKCHPEFTVFAAQNPQYQGGGRKGLPKSFVNRFTVVYVDVLSTDDLKMISEYLFPKIKPEIIERLINFVLELDKEVAVKRSFGHLGSPFEFNLRDTMRWLGLLNESSFIDAGYGPEEFLNIVVKDRFRTPKDREAVVALYEKQFGALPPTSLFAHMDTQLVQAGHSVMERTSLTEPIYTGLKSLQCNVPVLETAFSCLTNAWPLIIIGPSNSGKTCLIRSLAQTVGTELHEFAMNGDIDSMDLLGGFDQVDLNQKVSAILTEIKRFCIEASCSRFIADKEAAVDSSLAALDLLEIVNKIQISIPSLKDLCARMVSLGTALNDQKEQLETIIEKMGETNQAKFEWFDGTLLKAVEQGDWLVLDNANLCNPSVLDRLNSLLEINGCLIVNECSSANGEPRMVRPHKNFRLFLTMDPKYGELSRAMRNRGVEIFLDDVNNRATDFDRQLLGLAATAATTENDKAVTVASNFVPVSSFVSPNLATMHFFSLLEDSTKLGESLNTYFTVLAQFNFLPQNMISRAHRWAANVQKFAHYASAEKELSLRLVEFADSINNSSVKAAVTELSKTAVATFGLAPVMVEALSLNPVLNNYLAHHMKTTENGLAAQDIAMLLLVVPYLSITVQTLERARVNTKSLKPSMLTYLDRAAAAHTKVPLKNPARVDVYKMISAVLTFSDLVLKTIFTVQTSSVASSITALFQLQQICTDLISLTTTTTTDESQLHVYREFFDEWLAAHQATDLFSDAIAPLQSAVSEFGSQLILTSGTSMQTIWAKWRPQRPTSKLAWERYERIAAIASKFDEISVQLFVNSLDTVLALRSMIVQIVADATASSTGSDAEALDHAIATLENGIDALQKATLEFTTERHHYFKDGFKMLSQILEVSSSYKVEDVKAITDELSVLAYYSQGSTMHLTAYSNGNLSNPYHPVFDSLWTLKGTQYASFVDDLVNNKLAHKLVCYNSEMKNVASQDHNQAMLDLQTLCEHTLQHSSYFTFDKLRILNNMLFDRVMQIVQLHGVSIGTMPPRSEGLTKDHITELSSGIAAAENNKVLGQVFDVYFSVALELLLSNAADFKQMGRAWLLVSLGSMMLYVPSFPFDPAIRQHVEYDRAQLLATQYAEMRESWTTIKNIFIGCTNVELEKVWDERLPAVQNISVPSVYRPEVSRVGSIHEEWMTLIESSIGKSVIQPFINDETLSDEQLMQISLIQRNTTQFIGRSKANHEFYSDITSIFHGQIYGLKLGLDLLTLETLDSKPSPFFLTSPIYLSQSQKLYEAFVYYKEAIKSMPTRASEKVLLALLAAADMIQKIEGRPVPELEEITSFGYQNFYYKWSLNRIRKEQEAASKTTIFKDTSEEDAEKDFMRMFPDYEEIVEIDDEGIDQEEDYTALMSQYLRTYSDGSQLTLADLTSSGIEALQDLSDTFDFITYDVPSVLPSVVLSLSTTINGQALGSDELFDFYHQPKPDETVKVSKLIVRLKTQIAKFLEMWPEHATLQSIDTACEDLLSFPMSTPVARYLQRVEQLYNYIDEWERFTSRDFTVKPIFNEMTELIVSWRRLELSTWPKLFEVEEANLNKELGRWWFYLFENLIENPSKESASTADETLYPTLVQTLTMFMSQSNYGQFGTRLQLLRAFAKHTLLLAAAVPSMSIVSECISNVINYYSQYLTLVSNHIATGKKALQKDINEVILLASWKDTNVSALRESAKKSHTKLYKVLRKYRALLTASVEPLVNGGMESLPEGSVGFVASVSSSPSYKTVAGYISAVSSDSLWKERPARLVNVDTTASLLHKHLLSVQEESLPSLEKFAKEVVEEMDYLRKETPAILTEENKSQVSNLKNEKSKLFTDTLKELRRSGLKTNVKADIKAQQQLVSGIMAAVPSLTGKNVGLGDQYFYRILDLLPRLRVAVTESESDAPIADLVRGLAMSENLFASIISHRKVLNTLITENANVSSILATLNSFSSLFDVNDRIKLSGNYSDLVSHAQASVAWIPKVVKFATEACYQSITLGKFKYTQETFLFSETESRFKDLAVRFDKYKHLTSQEVMPESLNELVLLVRKELLEFANGLAKWNTKYPKLAFIGDMTTSWINERLATDVEAPQHSESTYTLADLDKISRNISDSVLVLVQKAREILNEDISQENDNWFIQSQTRLATFCKILRQPQFFRKIQQAMTIANSIGMQQDETAYAKALGLVGATIPFVHEYTELCSIIESRMIHNFATTNKGAYTLMRTLQNLASNGFCSPQEEQKPDEDSSATKDGTGLGDGSGAQNNSNDVEDDEDMSEHAQKDNEDQNKDDKDNDEDDNAVDIDGDMGAGDLEDASDQDKSDDEENDDEDENELDEEVGDVDDLDPNAVDEKMWDEKGEENDKEKKSDDIPEGGNDDDMQAKEDDEEQQGDGPEPKQSDEGNNDKNEEDENAEEEEDVGEQDDSVNQQEKEDLEPQVPETDTLELPEDMNLDGEDDDDEKQDGKEDDDDFDMPDAEDDEGFDGAEDKGKDEANKQDGMDADDDAEKEGDEEEEDQEIEADSMDVDENPAEEGEKEEGENEGEGDEEKPGEEEDVKAKPEEGEDPEVNKETDNNMKFDTEGLHGPDQADQDENADVDDSAVTQDNSTNQGEGSEQASEKEQENLENSGGASSTKPEEQKEKQEDEDDSNTQDQARKEVENSMKQLGDALKEFHNRKQEIKEASEQDDNADQGANERPDEFEHVDGANSSANETQALGAASQDQTQKIDESKAIDEDEEMGEPQEAEAREVDEADLMETDENMAPAGEESSDLPQTAGSVVGERKREEDINGQSLAGQAMDIDEDEDDEAKEQALERMFDVAEAGFEPARSLDESRDLWRDNETLTQESAMALCEQLRLILEPTQATKLRGDFKTGKRLNMKRIIPYIASQFKKDKIWMRRTKPSKRQYQVMIAVDDSKSMSESQSVKLAFQSIALISKALTQLEAGQLAIARFGETTQLVHPFEKPFSSESGAHALQWFGFDQERTDVKALVQKSITLFEEAGVGSSAAHNAAELWRLEIIVSDGVCESHDVLRQLVRKAREERIMMVFVIVDGVNNQDSILDLNEVRYETDAGGNMALKIDRYLDHFPFEFYVIVKDIRELPNVLSLVLRQFFAEVAETSG